MPSTPLPRRIVNLPLILMACVALLFGFAWMPVDWLATAMYLDDALYYPRVAANVMAGHGATYDMQTFTNGFHPLWGVVLLPAAGLAGGDHLLLARLATLLCAAFASLAVFALYDLGKKLSWGSLGSGAALAVIVITRADLWLSLMESALSLGLLTALVACAVRFDLLVTRSPRRLLALGALIAATFLARLDLIFVLGAIGVTSFVQRRRAGHSLAWIARDLGIAGTAALVPVLPYLLANHFFFGSIIPVSGRRKTTALPTFEQFQDAALYPAHAVANKLHLPVATVLIAGGLGLVAAFFLVRRRPLLVPNTAHWDRHGVILALFAGTALRWLYHRLFMFAEAGFTPWYWVPEYLCAAIAIGWAVTHFQHRLQLLVAPKLPLRLTGAILVVVVGGGYVYLDGERERVNNQAMLDNALWARDHLPADKVYAMYDSGLFSYFSQRNTIGLNGLVGDETLMRMALARDYDGMLQRHHVDYLVTFVPPEVTLPPAAVVHEIPAGVIKGYQAGRRMVTIDRRYFAKNVP